MEQAEEFIKKSLSTKAVLEPLPQSGSARKNYLVLDQQRKYILTVNENLEENESFLYFSELFQKLELNTPKIIKVSKDRRMYLQQYLGDQTLFETLTKDSENQDVENLLKTVLDQLYELQYKTQGQVDYGKTFEYEKYDELPILNDLNYFKFFILDLLELPYHKSRLLTEFRALSRIIEHLHPRGIMIRDFQSRNIMIDSLGQSHFIDYQSAMHGPLLYDVISFLYQARAPFPTKLKKTMLDYYIAKHPKAEIRKSLREAVMPLRLIRGLQVLGAYGLRGLVQRKPHFQNSLKLGIKQVFLLSKQWKGMEQFPELSQVIHELGQKSTKVKIDQILKS